MARGTCRCVMCGVKNSGRIHRGLYIRYGVRTDEDVSKGIQKVRERRTLRRRMKKEIQNDL